MHEPTLLYGINLGRIPIESRRKLMESLRGNAEDPCITYEQADKLREITEKASLYVCKTHWGNLALPKGDYYNLGQIHIGELMFKDHAFVARKGEGTDTKEEAYVVNVDRIVYLRRNPEDLISRLDNIGIAASKPDLALYLGTEEGFT